MRSDPVGLVSRLITFLLLNNFLRSFVIVREMNECADEFNLKSLVGNADLQAVVSQISGPFGVVMLNQYAADITLNFLCNTAGMKGVHEKLLIFTLDKVSRFRLLSEYPDLNVFTYEAQCLQDTFVPGDATYMSFFLLRTNLIRALLAFGRSFWMLQADTFWRDTLFKSPEVRTATSYQVALDQSGYDGSSDTRKGQMNGANFFVSYSEKTRKLMDDLFWYQSHFYVTDPDAIKVMCNSQHRFNCSYIDHRVISGWEWIYGDQSMAPSLIQMDGESGSGKIETLKRYNMWFLNEDGLCDRESVKRARKQMEAGIVPRLFSSSKLKQRLLIATGQLLSSLPIFGAIYRTYGGIPSLYLQFF
ncbi:hypothetical protein QR680_002939 [Steinernema hermaphroditum]|uniref:Nucleotide-diphospho-sugar transferase domain-containing protein n=1 Tax=Steinernema hermaphroditum TaxID=289476 RepID=A0AA39H5P3_9BILA|nr:hypothetical protein QR680_002939 [Steinernema hermaphroditum]